jgi:hypothetical protein
VCELNREVEDTDRRVVHRTNLLEKKEVPKKVLAKHHHRRRGVDGNLIGRCSSRPARKSHSYYNMFFKIFYCRMRSGGMKNGKRK